VVFRRIVNTSPLVLLSKIGLLDLLRAGDLDMIVPRAVLDELARHGPEDQALLVIRSTDWRQIAPSSTVFIRLSTLSEAGLAAGLLSTAVDDAIALFRHGPGSRIERAQVSCRSCPVRSVRSDFARCCLERVYANPGRRAASSVPREPPVPQEFQPARIKHRFDSARTSFRCSAASRHC
jgi:hypothetical protein